MAGKHQEWGIIRCPALFAVLLAVALLRPTPVAAAGVVGTGTPESCSETALDAALAGGGLVTFDCGPDAVTITIISTKTIAADATIEGGSLITISGGNRVGVFSVNTGVTFTVQNLTIANGNAIVGGGIHNEGGTVTVTNSTFSGNGATLYGGGISANPFGTVTVTNSTFSGNSAPAGGGIFGGTVTVTNSTFSGNSANLGGGIVNGHTLTVTNSTFLGNSAGDDGRGGGIDSYGTLTVTNSTFSGNSASYGGGIANDGTATIANTIIAASPSDGNCGGAITDGGHNIDDGTTCGFTGAGCASTGGSSFCNTNPQLDPAGLADNGGPTQTIALLPDSPAIDAGDAEVCANPPVNGLDQRGYVRPGVGHAQCSIGACEADAIPPTCTGDCNSNGRVAINELILGVNIVLDLKPETACPAFANSQGMVDIAQLITGVDNALGGCVERPVRRVPLTGSPSGRTSHVA